jgi:hypothetical protein
MPLWVNSAHSRDIFAVTVVSHAVYVFKLLNINGLTLKVTNYGMIREKKRTLGNCLTGEAPATWCVGNGLVTNLATIPRRVRANKKR